MSFKALVLNQVEKKTIAEVQTMELDQLPEGEVLVKVACSTLNYKDALAVTGKGKIVREFPFIPGIDFAGVVEQSSDDNLAVGTEVVLTGWGVGERYFGGLSQYARVKAKWLLPLPQKMDAATSMRIGTAGLTGALCVQRLLDNGVQPTDGPVVVSGASGGVGSFAVQLLAKLGFEVHAISRPESTAYLQKLGASVVLDRVNYAKAERPLDKGIWAAGVDTVGSGTLAKILAEGNSGATIACCGLAGGFDLPTTVMPFILRGITLAGVDSVYASNSLRQKAWALLAEHISAAEAEAIGSKCIALEEVAEACSALLAGQHQGRVVVDLSL